ncbi:prephenate dehydrogenase [Treponema brennaborense]|uniref:Prephenate dehydrogenase n=1 Tax=Treponema brennaborense (strain DSM 12168 / CIP 105900 / DD5/3) TaxID=906968 RepID=F4LIV2_TREBD|nr:prephenate dehydrogenase [Treponema brennaborense]AEE16277.1 Prephenate dehydrogenase [Treponema brennaborense DSM 12168]
MSGRIVSQNGAHLTYGFVGLGLMGGSLAKAIRANILGGSGATGRILACDANAASLRQAEADGIAAAGFPPERADAMLAQCDVVFVCLYPHATLEFITAHRHSFKPESVVTDISGVKTALLEGLGGSIRDDVDFISGHPMAGSEKEGYAHAAGTIFSNRNYILMPRPENTPEHLAFFRNLVTAIGFTRIIETDAHTHDRKIAFTSQLCHVIASALVDSAEDTSITAFGGGSFEDLTRIALINAPLWTELFTANRTELLAHMTAFCQSLEKFRRCIEDADEERLHALLESVRVKRTDMSRIDMKDRS